MYLHFFEANHQLYLDTELGVTAVVIDSWLVAAASRARRRGHWAVGGRVYLFIFHRIPPSGGNEISGEISPNFANSERKVILNSKTEISFHSDRNFGDFDRNFGDFDRNLVFQPENDAN